jgi:hypothetical protein
MKTEKETYDELVTQIRGAMRAIRERHTHDRDKAAKAYAGLFTSLIALAMSQARTKNVSVKTAADLVIQAIGQAFADELWTL